MKGAALVPLLLLVSTVLSPAVMGLRTIDSGTVLVVTVERDFHDAYKVMIPDGSNNTIRRDSANIQFKGANADLDFYVFTESNYAEYLDPTATVFHYQDQLENARDFTYSTTESGLVFVVDNARVSTSGASPTGPVTYLIEVIFEIAATPQTGPTLFSIAMAAIAGVGVVGAVAFVLLRQRRKRESQQVLPPPPPFEELPPPPPTQVASTTAGPAFPQAEQQAPPQVPQQVQTPEQKEKLRRSTLTISALTIGMAIAYVVVQDIITMSLAIVFMFATLGHVSKINKMRKALALGGA